MATFTRLTAMKLLELILVIVLIVLYCKDNSGTLRFTEMLTTATFGGYLIILIGVFASAFMGSSVGRQADIFFSIVGLALFIIVGGLLINEAYVWKGVISIIIGVILLIDAIFTFRGEN